MPITIRRIVCPYCDGDVTYTLSGQACVYTCIDCGRDMKLSECKSIPVREASDANPFQSVSRTVQESSEEM